MGSFMQCLWLNIPFKPEYRNSDIQYDSYHYFIDRIAGLKYHKNTG